MFSSWIIFAANFSLLRLTFVSCFLSISNISKRFLLSPLLLTLDHRCRAANRIRFEFDGARIVLKCFSRFFYAINTRASDRIDFVLCKKFDIVGITNVIHIICWKCCISVIRTASTIRLVLHSRTPYNVNDIHQLHRFQTSRRLIVIESLIFWCLFI